MQLIIAQKIFYNGDMYNKIYKNNNNQNVVKTNDSFKEKDIYYEMFDIILILGS